MNVSESENCNFNLTQTIRLKFPKKLIKKKLFTRAFLLLIFIYVLYIFGAFTHLFEKNLTKIYDIQIETIKNEINIIDQNDVNKLNFTFIHKADHICSNDKRPPFLVMLIKSKITHFDRRNVIRSTWAQTDPYGIIKRVFLIGLPHPNENDQERQIKKSQNQTDLTQLESENKKYRDIVQQDFLDVYYNNTLKTCMGVRWAVDYCSNAKYFLFIDDDFYLNPNLLIDYLKNNITEEMFNTLYAGYVFGNSSPMRHHFSKWYISLQDYPYDKFPPYASAGCYLLTSKSIRLFNTASKLIKLFKFDDIYMGILAYEFKIKPIHISNVYFHAPSYSASIYAKEIMAAHRFTSNQLAKIWIQLQNIIKFKPKSYEEF